MLQKLFCKTGYSSPSMVNPAGPLGTSCYDHVLLKCLTDGPQLSPSLGGPVVEGVEVHEEVIDLGEK